jgi:hypothetical protein
MPWGFLLDNRLHEMNQERANQGRRPLTWEDVERLTGVKQKVLLNLAYNSEPRATNTRFIEALCRFFCCGPKDLMTLVTPGERDVLRVSDEPDHDEIDRLLDVSREGGEEVPDYHVTRLYEEDATLKWRAGLGEIRARLRAIRRD